MSCGRIPLFVNTDSVLPYENVLDWKDLCVWVVVMELDQERRPCISQQARHARDHEFLSPHGFFRNLWRVVA